MQKELLRTYLMIAKSAVLKGDKVTAKHYLKQAKILKDAWNNDKTKTLQIKLGA